MTNASYSYRGSQIPERGRLFPTPGDFSLRRAEVNCQIIEIMMVAKAKHPPRRKCKARLASGMVRQALLLTCALKEWPSVARATGGPIGWSRRHGNLRGRQGLPLLHRQPGMTILRPRRLEHGAQAAGGDGAEADFLKPVDPGRVGASDPSPPLVPIF